MVLRAMVIKKKMGEKHGLYRRLCKFFALFLLWGFNHHHVLCHRHDGRRRRRDGRRRFRRRGRKGERKGGRKGGGGRGLLVMDRKGRKEEVVALREHA